MVTPDNFLKKGAHSCSPECSGIKGVAGAVTPVYTATDWAPSWATALSARAMFAFKFMASGVRNHYDIEEKGLVPSICS